MIPAPDLLDYTVGVGGPDEWPGIPVVLGEIAVDRLLQRHQGERCPIAGGAGSAWRKKVSTAFSHEHEVGVKWKVQCVASPGGWPASARRRDPALSGGGCGVGGGGGGQGSSSGGRAGGLGTEPIVVPAQAGRRLVAELLRLFGSSCTSKATL